MDNQTKNLVVFFSHTGENWQVGYITKGNTHIVADILADKLGADKFEIKPVKEYPTRDHDRLIAEAKEEKLAKARPEIESDIAIEGYDTIYLGFPNWWAELPMCAYTFLDKHLWKNKKVIPFVTHGGGGMSGIDKKIQTYLPEAEVAVGNGLVIEGKMAQQNQEQVTKIIEDWLKTNPWI